MKPFAWYFLLYFCTILNVRSKEDVLLDKIQQLTDLSSKKPVIRLNNERFNHFIKTAPRNYSVIIMFTALSPQRQCSICKPAHDEYQVLAQSYRYSNAFSNKLFFAMVDFDEGPEVFQSLKLNTAPVFIHFAPKTKPKKADQMDISRTGFSAEQIAKWVHDRTEITIQIYRPKNYSGMLLAAFLVITGGSLLYVKRKSLKFLYSHVIWGLFVIGVVCYFISGQTWNMINGPPFMSPQKNGMDMFAGDSNMQYVAETYIGLFSGSSGYQFIAETYIVFLLYFGVSAGIILLNEAPKLKSQKGKRRTMVAILGIVMVIALFSYILSIFRSKYQGYPYSFLIK